MNTALLDIVRAPEGWGVFASNGPNYRHTIFGRDSIEVAEDIYEYDQDLAHDIILTLARLQGTTNNQDSEEEPGKIHHEYRSATFAGLPVPSESIAIMQRLQREKKWDDASKDTMLYYGSYDATPLYVRLIQKYTAKYGDEILHETYTDKDGVEQTVTDSVHWAANWLAGKLHQRDDRLLAYCRSNPEGIENQVWKDSLTAYIFSDGTMPDHDKGIVSTELQGYTYDALLFAAHLFPKRSKELLQTASMVQHSTITKLWMPSRQFFAQGIGTHSSGEERTLNTMTSNGALLLDSNLLKDLPDWARNMYVKGIEKMMLGPEFLTPAGIRCRAAKHAELLSYIDYHGCYTVWAKETSDVARGLENYGRTSAAVKLRRATLNSFLKASEFYELFYVDLDNTVFYDQDLAMVRFSSATMGEPLPMPERSQAWSISAAIASAHHLAKQPIKMSFQDSFDKARQHKALVAQRLTYAQHKLKRARV